MDHFSSLPEEVLCHILSFLTTKDAALTSVLSKRWRNLIAFVPYLDIDNSVFLHPEEGKRDRPKIIESFMDFVDRILALQGNSPIKKLSIKCRTSVDSVRVDNWISNVLARGVSDLDLDIILDKEEDDYYHYRLSPKCFQSNTLVKLKLDYGTDLCWFAGNVLLPVLKTLVLEAVQLKKFENFLRALPALEELVLVDINWQDTDVIVSSTSLKTLRIDIDESLDSLSFDTPSLVYFEYYGYIASDYPVVNMTNLLNARVIFSLTEEDIERAREPNNDLLADDQDVVALGFSNVWKLFHGLRNILNLHLSSDTLEVLSLCCEKMPVFNNLKSLSIKSGKDRGWQAMPVLLRNCPRLETLVIEGLMHHVTDKCGDACECVPREEKGMSLASCPVKMLEIQGFRGTMKEMNTIKHFLDYFPCLKDMEIFIEEDDPTQLKNPEIADLVVEMIELYNELSSCNVQLLMSDYLDKKWTEQGSL